MELRISFNSTYSAPLFTVSLLCLAISHVSASRSRTLPTSSRGLRQYSVCPAMILRHRVGSSSILTPLPSKCETNQTNRSDHVAPTDLHRSLWFFFPFHTSASEGRPTRSLVCSVFQWYFNGVPFGYSLCTFKKGFYSFVDSFSFP